MACEEIQAEIDGLLRRVEALQDELSEAPPPRKAAIVRMIRAVNMQIAAKEQALSRCLALAGLAPISTTFSGTATLRTTDSRAPGPFAMPISFGFFFFEGHGSVKITDFPELVTDPFEVDTPFGRKTNVTVVRKTSGGDGLFNKSSGGFAIPVGLFLDHSLDFPFVEEDSSLSIVLQTGAAGGFTGAPLDRATGKLILVGTGRFVDGILDGATGTVILDGRLATVP